MSFSAWRAALDEVRKGRLKELAHIPERMRMWRIAERLDAARLHRLDEQEPFALDDLLGSPEARAGRVFLGVYSEAGLLYAFKQYGIWQHVVDVSQDEPVLRIEGTGETVQSIRITDGPGGPEIVEVRASLRYGFGADDSVNHDLPGPRNVPWLHVEWLKLQHPYKPFPPERARLPGQDHPGLGIGREAMEMMLISGWRLGCLGVVSFPAWFHNAVLYRIHYRFVDPVEEGRFLALVDAWLTAGISLSQASFDVDEGRVRDPEGREVYWHPGPMVAPLDERAELEHDNDWLEAVAEAHDEASYVFPAVSGLGGSSGG